MVRLGYFFKNFFVEYAEPEFREKFSRFGHDRKKFLRCTREIFYKNRKKFLRSRAKREKFLRFGHAYAKFFEKA